MLEYLCCIEED